MIFHLSCPRGEMDITQVSETWGPGSIPGEGNTPDSGVNSSSYPEKILVVADNEDNRYILG